MQVVWNNGLLEKMTHAQPNQLRASKTVVSWRFSACSVIFDWFHKKSIVDEKSIVGIKSVEDDMSSRIQVGLFMLHLCMQEVP